MHYYFIEDSSLLCRSIGYQSFNIYGLAILKKGFPEHPFWKSRKFKAIWEYSNSNVYEKTLQNNIYGFPYNPPGFEMAYGLEIFESNSEEKQSAWVSNQFKRCFDFSCNLMIRNTEDPITHAARLYEAARLPNLALVFD